MSAAEGSGRRERVVPTGTYRFQIQSAFTFDDAAARAAYLGSLGVSHAYLSPVLAATKGSTHGYDVVDHSRLNPEAGGREAFDRLTKALAGYGLAAVADVVPNHMAVPTPASDNRQLWSVMREGPHSPFAKWFDVDWSVPDRALLVPVLGGRIGQVLAAGELSLDTGGPEPLLRYYEHVFPVRPGTEHLPLPQLVDRQWYRLAHWRVADEELNYRRFFDVDTLAAIRVEDEEVFDATHELLLELLHAGQLDGLRIDHPDGLADPAGYLRRLRAATDRGDGGAWVVVEKIVEGDETLEEDWACDGTTGYDALHVVGGLFLDPAGAAPLLAHYATLTGETSDFHEVVDKAKREVVEHGLYAEVHRLVDLLVDICHADVDLRDHTRRGLHESVVELLVAMDRYRAYVVPGEPAPAESERVLRAAAERARHHLPAERHDTLDVVVDLALGLGTADTAGESGSTARRAEFVVRFQQTCGPVMAKGVEDTAFYRWFRLSSLNEVGGEPARFGVAPEEFHAYSARLARDWPATMTTLSTHDTKRSEDVRAQLSGLSERHEEWHQALSAWREAAGPHREAELDTRTEVLIWQTVVGTWGAGGPISAERLVAYLEKATREAKDHTTWTAPDEAYETAVRRFAEGILGDPAIREQVGAFVASLAGSTRTAVLGQKLLQLVMPGVPDVYQGSELVDLSLVDPDNRRPVDYAERERRLAELDAGRAPADLSDEKLLVTSRALRLRREHPEWFLGPQAAYAPVPTSTGNAVAVARGDGLGTHVVAVATRLPVALERNGGWGEHTLALPEGTWRCVLTGTTVPGGGVRLAELLEGLPVALLVRDGGRRRRRVAATGAVPIVGGTAGYRPPAPGARHDSVVVGSPHPGPRTVRTRPGGPAAQRPAQPPAPGGPRLPRGALRPPGRGPRRRPPVGCGDHRARHGRGRLRQRHRLLRRADVRACGVQHHGRRPAGGDLLRQRLRAGAARRGAARRHHGRGVPHRPATGLAGAGARHLLAGGAPARGGAPTGRSRPAPRRGGRAGPRRRGLGARRRLRSRCARAPERPADPRPTRRVPAPPRGGVPGSGGARRRPSAPRQTPLLRGTAPLFRDPALRAHPAAHLVRAVAVRRDARAPAAAQRDRRPAALHRFTLGVDDARRAAHQQRAVRAHRDGHLLVPARGCGCRIGELVHAQTMTYPSQLRRRRTTFR
ncbi:hypothetical protein NUM3379_05620 [Kineococcus sp. NUM-3379]